MGDLTGAPESWAVGVEEEDIGQMIGLFWVGAGGTQGAPGDEGPYPVNC
jgi:hypothetical protein